MRRYLTIIGFGLGGIAVVLGLTLGAYAVVGDPIRQPVVNVRDTPTNSSTHSASPEPEHTAEPTRSPDDHGGASGGSDDTGSDDHGGNSGSGSDDSSGSGSDNSGSGSDNSGSGSSGSGGGDDGPDDD
ncbi:MAG TPA: hypothetical protein VGR41_03975 [Actinomycetota bacterium]|jgi:hypothetical protein|nr:hypothetical protein [Actinomycetota bacterium]